MLIELHEGGPPVTVVIDDAVATALGRTEALDVRPVGNGEWELSPRWRVGVLSVGDVQVSIRPKVAIARIVFMLGYTNHPGWRDDTVALADVDDLVPALADAFVAQAEDALALGLLQGYVEVEDSLTVLRGRLREQDQLRQRFGIALPLLVRYDDHSVDIAENRLLRGAVELLLRVPGVHDRTRPRLRHLRQKLAEVTPLVAGVRLPSWSPSRLNTRYHVALWLAELLLTDNAVDQRAGSVRVNGFLVDMAKVFEDFLTVALGRALERRGGRVTGQYRSHLDVDRRVRMRPDIVWTVDGSPAAVIDAKYKAETPSGYPNADKYQMLAYCTVLSLADGHLIYAEGGDVGVAHTVRNAGVTIHSHSVDLDVEPAELLANVDELAERIAACRGVPESEQLVGVLGDAEAAAAL